MRTLLMVAMLAATLIGSANAEPKKFIVIEGKLCLVLNAGVKCPGEGPKCISLCRSSDTTKDDRPFCEKSPPCV